MPSTATINIDDHFSGSPLASSTLRYIVEFRIEGTDAYQRYYPDPTTTPIVVDGLEDDQIYQFRIARVCSNQGQSDWAEFDVDTTVE